MRTNDAVILAFVVAWILPPYSWLIYELLNPTSFDETRAWKYQFERDPALELSFLTTSIVAFLMSSAVATFAGLLVKNIRSFSIVPFLPKYAADIVLVLSILGMLYGVLSYFTIFITLFLLLTRSYVYPFFGILALLLVIWFQIQGYFTYKFWYCFVMWRFIF